MACCKSRADLTALEKIPVGFSNQMADHIRRETKNQRWLTCCQADGVKGEVCVTVYLWKLSDVDRAAEGCGRVFSRERILSQTG